jgi:hypothetical protein
MKWRSRSASVVKGLRMERGSDPDEQSMTLLPKLLIFATFGGSARDQPRKVSSQLDTKTVRERARKNCERGREFLHPGHFHV